MILKYEDVIRIRKELTGFYDKVSKIACTDEVVLELMQHRGYTTQCMFDTLKEVKLTKIDYLSDLLFIAEASETQLKEWGLVTKSGDYLLGGRYVVPIRDTEGLISALVGWDKNGGARKYVTSPTWGFSRDTMFFNMECYTEIEYNSSGVAKDDTLFVVEGIFDTLSLRSLGLNAYGNMGLHMSSIKTEILRRWGKVVAIPDNDTAGMTVNSLTNKYTGKSAKDIWEIKNDHVFVSLPKGVKDMDDFIKGYDCLEDLERCKSAQCIIKLKEDF